LTIDVALTGSGGTFTGTHPFNTEKDGYYKIVFRAEDNAVNTGGGASPNAVEEDYGFSLLIDRTAPIISRTLSAEPNEAGWYKAPFTATWTCEDNPPAGNPVPPVSGCDDATLSGKTTYPGPDTAAGSITGTGKDKAANEGSNTYNFKYDASPPTDVKVTGITDGHVYYFGDTIPTAGCSANFDVSGPKATNWCVVTDTVVLNPAGNTNGYGSHTLKATATDNADNVAYSPEVKYTKSPWTLKGFYQPVDMSPNAPTTIVFNTLRGGQTAPLKFEIFAGTTEFITTTFNANPIGTFGTKKVSCDTSTVSDAIEQLETTGGTRFRYDTTAGQYIQDWQTPKYNANGQNCYLATFTTQDGSSLSAYFKILK
jgi:hypothetical protein